MHDLCPGNFVFTKHEPTLKRGNNHYGYLLRCQEARRGEKPCRATWKVHTHPEDPVQRGDVQPLYYTLENFPPPEAHNHLPDMGNVVKR